MYIEGGSKEREGGRVKGIIFSQGGGLMVEHGDAHMGAYAVLKLMHHQASKPSSQPPYPLEILEQPLIYSDLRTGIKVHVSDPS